MKKMKESDKFIYFLIIIIAVLTVAFITYCIIFRTMNLMNMPEFSRVLIDMKIYQYFYNILNNVSKMALHIFVIVSFSAIPYSIISIVLGIIFIKKYIKYKGEKKKQIIQTIILGTIATFIIIDGITLYPMTQEYEIAVNSRINNVSNLEVKEFLKTRIEGNKYVYKIKIRRSFPDDYDVTIYYRDIIKKEKETFLSDSYSDFEFIKTNATDSTNTLAIKSILLTTIGEALYICFVIYILKEFKRISE